MNSKSLPSGEVWIEIEMSMYKAIVKDVTSLRGSVD